MEQNESLWRGFHHIALVTPDLDATMQFYSDILGMQVKGLYAGGDGRPRHCFIQPGNTEAWGLHFFEKPDAQMPLRQEIPRGFLWIPGALQHIAFALGSEVDALALRERLAGHSIEMTTINEIGPIRNFLFWDNHNLLLEAAWAKG